MFLNLWQHSTMHAFFAMAGVVGVLTRCKFQIPVGLDHLLFSLALFNEGLLFYTHSSRMSALDKYIHYILLIPILSGAVCSLFEVWFRNNPILELFRTSMFITQGTWLWQIAFLLWGTSSWDHNDPETYVFMAICYSWHYGSVILFLTWLWLTNGTLKETEGLILAAQEQAIRTNAIKAKIEKSADDPKCRLCKETDETIDHILSCCKKTAQTDYKQRHNCVAQMIHWNLCLK
uniref:Transmembrane protein 45B n=1 Tax=Anolis carolinensis TaxID=28377 RepID=A0A803TQZ4_ANOCA